MGNVSVLMSIFSIMFWIIIPNVVSMLLGWDGLGLVSYLLVICYQNLKSCGAGMLTVLSNRIGGMSLLMVIAGMLNFGSWKPWLVGGELVPVRNSEYS